MVATSAQVCIEPLGVSSWVPRKNYKVHAYLHKSEGMRREAF